MTGCFDKWVVRPGGRRGGYQSYICRTCHSFLPACGDTCWVVFCLLKNTWTILVWYQIDNNNHNLLWFVYLLISSMSVNNKLAESYQICKFRPKLQFHSWSYPWPPTVPPACSWLSDRSEDHENGPKWFLMPQNLGLDTKMKCLAWPETKLQLFATFRKSLVSRSKPGFRFWRPVDTFFKDMIKCV